MIETVTCCREWIVLPHWGNPKSVGLQYDYAPVVRLGPGEQYHCRYCGARFRLRPDGTVEVGPSVAKLLAGIKRIVSRLSRNTHNCPRDTGVGCPYCLEPDGDLNDTDECDPLDRDADQVARCWIAVGWPEHINDTRALWARMEEVAKCE